MKKKTKKKTEIEKGKELIASFFSLLLLFSCLPFKIFFLFEKIEMLFSFPLVLKQKHFFSFLFMFCTNFRFFFGSFCFLFFSFPCPIFSYRPFLISFISLRCFVSSFLLFSSFPCLLFDLPPTGRVLTAPTKTLPS